MGLSFFKGTRFLAVLKENQKEANHFGTILGAQFLKNETHQSAVQVLLELASGFLPSFQQSWK